MHLRFGIKVHCYNWAEHWSGAENGVERAKNGKNSGGAEPRAGVGKKTEKSRVECGAGDHGAEAERWTESTERGFNVERQNSPLHSSALQLNCVVDLWNSETVFNWLLQWNGRRKMPLETWTRRSHVLRYFHRLLFKPLPPVGAGGGYMFSGRPSMPLSVRPCVRPETTWIFVLFQWWLTAVYKAALVAYKRLRSVDNGEVVVPRPFTLCVGAHGFCLLAPRVWNDLPSHLRDEH